MNITDISNIISYIVLFFSIYFNVFLLISFFEKKSLIKIEDKIKPKHFRSTTIVVPVFNEEKTVTKSVLSLLDLDYPKNKLKIIIVDDGSTDNTWRIIQKFKKNKQIEVFHKENGGKHTALNFALEKIKTELVGCLDADSFVEKDALKKIVSHFENPKTMAVTPSIKIYKPNNFIRHVQDSEYNYGIFIKKTLDFINGINVTPGPFSIFRKRVFDEIGGFKPAHNTEDMEIAFRMHKFLYRITNSHKAIVYTAGPGTYKALYKQRVRWSHGFFANILDYRFLIFNKKYSGIGMFTLPSSLIAMGSFFVFLILFLIMIGKGIVNKVIEIKTVGFHISWSSFNLDWFYINTDLKLFLGIALIILTIGLIIYGKKISENKSKFSWHFLYFPFVYSIIAVPWLIKAFYTLILSKETKWR